MRHWLGANIDELTAFMAERGFPAYRAAQFFDWLHNKRVADFSEMKNLPAALRSILSEHGQLRRLAEVERRDAADGLTVKWLFAAPDGADQRHVESVLIMEKRRTRRTVCVSSMAGCPLGCVFCATGRLGYSGNLEAGEIVEQIYRVDAHARQSEDDQGLSHVVFMGMGEPLLNLDAVLAAAAAIANPDGMGLSGRHITISTVGVPEGIRRLAAAGVNYRLALSLHAPNQKLREKIIPAAKRWPLSQLIPALEEFAAVASRELTYEYCLIDKFNASPAHARELAELVKDLKGMVNLIPLNPVAGFDAQPPSPATVTRFRDELEHAGIRTTIRVEKGAEIGAACGQLKAEMTARPGREA